MKKLLVTTAIIAFCSSPAYAATGGDSSGGGLFSSLTDWFNQAKQTVEGQVKNFSTQLGKFGKEFEDIAKGATGDLGLPDPAQLRQNANKTASDNPVYSAGQVANEGDRQSARASAAGILSQDGQTQQATAYNQTQSSIGAVNQVAQAAQSDDVTQNVIKRIATQNTQTSQVLGGMRADLLKLNEQHAQGNLQLTNISKGIDGQSKARSAEAVGAGFQNLRTASLANLF